MKIKITPGTFIGDGGDSRVTRMLHMGTTIEDFKEETDVTSERISIANDYGAYTMNYQRNCVKRYYKPFAYEKKQGNALWIPTSSDAYSNAKTYMKWEI